MIDLWGWVALSLSGVLLVWWFVVLPLLRILGVVAADEDGRGT